MYAQLVPNSLIASIYQKHISSNSKWALKDYYEIWVNLLIKFYKKFLNTQKATMEYISFRVKYTGYTPVETIQLNWKQKSAYRIFLHTFLRLNTIWYRFDLTRFRKDFSMCRAWKLIMKCRCRGKYFRSLVSLIYIYICVCICTYIERLLCRCILCVCIMII